MDPDNPVVRLCTQGMQAESQGRADEARDLFLQAWKVAQDDYEACIAAHYLARHQPTPEETLHWNQECLDRADRVGDERVRGFYASLHGNMGRSHLELGQVDQAREHFLQAARRSTTFPPASTVTGSVTASQRDSDPPAPPPPERAPTRSWRSSESCAPVPTSRRSACSCPPTWGTSARPVTASGSPPPCGCCTRNAASPPTSRPPSARPSR